MLGARPSMDPPVVVASFSPDADPITILMVRLAAIAFVIILTTLCSLKCY